MGTEPRALGVSVEWGRCIRLVDCKQATGTSADRRWSRLKRHLTGLDRSLALQRLLITILGGSGCHHALSLSGGSAAHLSAAYRQWVLNEERFRLRSDREPTMADLWVGSTASPSCFARPRPQDFDPDPSVRRRRTPLPAAARGDPKGLRNMLAAMKSRGLHARLDRLGDPPHLRGSILVKMPIKGRAQFAALAERNREDVPVRWRLVWDGNDSRAGRRRYRVAIQTPEYAALLDVLRSGRRNVQTELALA